jgi:hypothetical protein
VGGFTVIFKSYYVLVQNVSRSRSHHYIQFTGCSVLIVIAVQEEG